MRAYLLLPAVLAIPIGMLHTDAAACSLTETDANTLTLTVSARGCARTPEDKAAFARGLRQAVADMNAEDGYAAGAGGYEAPLPRNATLRKLRTNPHTTAQRKLYNFEALRRQSNNLSSGMRYYGQH